MELLTLVILVILYTKLINALGKENIKEFAWELYTRVAPSSTFKELREAKRKAIDLHTERSNTSSKDEFAKWAKLDRQYTATKTSIDKINSEIQQQKKSFKFLIKAVLLVATTGVKFFIRFKYRKSPVFWLPPNILPYYVLWGLSFSSAPMNSVSISSWLFICEWSISSIINVITKVYTSIIPATVTPQPTASKAKASN